MSRPRITETQFKRLPRSGRQNWYFCYRHPGDERWTRESSGLSLSTPDEVVEREFQLWCREVVAVEKPITLYEVLGAYLKSRKDQVKDYERLKNAVKGIKKVLPDIPPDKITEKDYVKYRENRGVSRSTARKELGVVKWACKKAGIAVEVPLPGNLPPRDDWLDEEQLKRLLERVRAFHLRLFIMIAVTTGQRATSILNLPWSQVDFERGVIDFNDYEREITTKRRAVVPMAAEVKVMMLHAKERAQTDWVIEWGGKRVTRVYRGIKRYGQEMGMPWLTPHVLKHTAVSQLASRGHSIEAIADFTETSVATIKRIYRKVNPEKYRSMADDLGGLVGAGGLFEVSAPTGRRNPQP